MKKLNKIDSFLNENVFLDEFHLNNVKLIENNVLSEAKINEEKINFLLEKRGVAMYDFRTEIHDIVVYIMNQFYNQYKNIVWIGNGEIEIMGKRYKCDYGENDISFSIPKQITKKISFIKNLNINVVISSFKNVNIDEKTILTTSGNSFSEMKRNGLSLFRNKIKNGNITCGLVSFNGVLAPKQVAARLYHELGHYYQDFNLKRNKSSLFNQTKNDSYYSNKNVFSTSSNEYIVKIGKILYTLFNKTELSQHASQIYGELCEMKPELNNINNALRKTYTYNWYEEIKGYIEDLNNYNSVDIWEASKKFYKTKSHPQGFINLTPIEFKEKFIKLSIKYLNIFYRKMMNSVELYVEDILGK